MPRSIRLVAALALAIGLVPAVVLAQTIGSQSPQDIAVACSQLPALTGDVTTTAGICATTIGTVGGKAFSLAGPLSTTGAGTVVFALPASSTTTYTFPAASSTLASTAQLPAGANPSATATGTVINGSASTFMRSDGAPAITTATNAALGLAEAGTGLGVTAGVFSVTYGTTAGSAAQGNDARLGAGALTLISTLTADGSLTAFSWTGLGSTYNNYKLICLVQPSATDSFEVQFGEGATPTWKTSGYAIDQVADQSGTPVGFYGNGTVGMYLSTASYAAYSTGTIMLDLTIYGVPGGSGIKAGLTGTVSTSGGAALSSNAVAGQYPGDTTAKTAIRLTTSTADAFTAGQCSLYGITN